MLQFEIDANGTTIRVLCDAKGMATLLGALARLVGERSSHVHLRAPSAGGSGNYEYQLDDNASPNGTMITQVVIDYAEGD
jgi:hypothetical protein